MIKLYTLPTCGICKMIEKKLLNKQISFEKIEGEQFFIENNIETAPVLQLEDGTLFTSPVQINNWIKEVGE